MSVNIGNDWQDILEPEFKKEYYLKLRQFLISEYKTYTVYPHMNNIFEALKLTSYKETKVLLLGQDPYHGPNQAHGLAFSVQKGVPIPPSLQNMFTELTNDLGCYMPSHGNLVSWAEQGVLLLNTALTVRAGMADSHKNRGWEEFTDRIIIQLNARQEPVVFLLWGNNARAKKKLITNRQHLVLEAPHPSPLAASRGFFGCRHFSKANEFIVGIGKEAIDWQIV